MTEPVVPNPALTPVSAGVFDTPQDAATEAVTALRDVPLHLGISGVDIWRYNDTVARKGGKWTWSARLMLLVGGYDHERRSLADDQKEYQDRVKKVLDALTAANARMAEANDA